MKDYEKAVSVDKSDDYALASLAWLLATCPKDKYRDGKRALKLAQLANDLSNDAFLSELAAALAEVGDFNSAVKAQKRAIKKCQEPAEKTKLEKYLQLFASGQPYRDTDYD